MKSPLRMLAAALTALAVAIPAYAAKDVVFAVASTFTTFSARFRRATENSFS